MIEPRFEHHQPEDLAELLALVDEHAGGHRLIAGGTDLIPRMRRGLLDVGHVISVNRVAELAVIELEGDRLCIGAGARVADVGRVDVVRRRFSALAHACAVMATPQIRNAATVVGNLVNASPCADTAGPLLAYDAELRIVSARGERRLPLGEFFKGPGQVDLGSAEIVHSLIVPLPPASSRASYHRLSARSRVDIAAVSVAAWLDLGGGQTIEAARIAIGAVAPTPLRCQEAEGVLAGERASAERIAAAAGCCAAAASPISDVRAEADYRALMVDVLARRAIADCLSEARS